MSAKSAGWGKATCLAVARRAKAESVPTFPSTPRRVGTSLRSFAHPTAAAFAGTTVGTTAALLRRLLGRRIRMAACRHQSDRDAADGKQRHQPLDPDGADELDADRHHGGIGEQRVRRASRFLLGPHLDLMLARHV